MIDIKAALEHLTLKELHRIYKCEVKEFISFDIIVMNAGAVVRFKLTNNYTESCDYVLYLDHLFKASVLKAIRDKLDDLSVSWGKFCYHVTWEDHLKNYGISESMHQKLLRLV